MCNRFYENDRPPKIVGNCAACHDEIQDGYEQVCKSCRQVHCKDCMRTCWVCERLECQNCMTKKDANGELLCEICLDKREYLIKTIIDGISFPILSYYFSGESETDDENIFEYSSIEHPPVRVCIKKVRE